MSYASMTVIDRLELWIPVLVCFMTWVVMQWNDKLPSTKSIQHFVSIINSRGGNIVILTIASVYFFRYSMYIFMDLLNMVKDKTISEDNAFALMAIQFVTTSAFGGSMGALLKTMTGESSTARSTDSVVDAPGTKITSNTSISGTVPPTKPSEPNKDASQVIVAQETPSLEPKIEPPTV
jgi:hypothetical protein